MVPTALSAQPELMAQACTQGRSPLQVCRAASPVHTPKRNRALLASPVNTLAAVRQCVLAGGVVRLDCDSLPHSSTAATSFEAHCSACGSLTAEPDRWRSVRYFGAAESSGGTMGHADLLEDQLRVCRLQLVDVPRLPPINTQHSTVGCCASVSVGAVAQHRCGRAANAHSDVPGRGCAACTSARARSTGRRPTGPRRCTPRGSACQSGRTGCTPARRQPARCVRASLLSALLS